MKVYIQYVANEAFNEVTFDERQGLVGAAPTPVGMLIITRHEGTEKHRFYGNIVFAEISYDDEIEAFEKLLVPDSGLIVP